MRTLDIITPPAVEPVSLAEAKLHLGVATSLEDTSFTADDDLIQGLIESARDWCESYCNRAFVYQTLALTCDSFPWGGGYFNRANRMNPQLNNFLPTQSGVIKLDKPPFVSMTSIDYLNVSGNWQTLSPSIYRVIGGSKNQPRLTTAPNQLWPATYPTMAAVVITWIAGYSADATLVPAGIKAAIKLLVSHWYNNRDAAADPLTSIPYGVESILTPFETGTYR